MSSHRKESLARAYIQAIAGQAGLACAVHDYDYGIDLTLREVAAKTSSNGERRRYVSSGFALDVQAKSTTTAVVGDDVVSYDLDIDAYDDLREVHVGTPRILVLLVLPDEGQDPISQDEDSLRLCRCCYWVSLRGWGAVANRRSRRIALPRRNIFSVEGVRDIFDRLRRSEEL
jgi:hypothetical protein